MGVESCYRFLYGGREQLPRAATTSFVLYSMRARGRSWQAWLRRAGTVYAPAAWVGSREPWEAMRRQAHGPAPAPPPAAHVHASAARAPQSHRALGRPSLTRCAPTQGKARSSPTQCTSLRPTGTMGSAPMPWLCSAIPQKATPNNSQNPNITPKTISQKPAPQKTTQNKHRPQTISQMSPPSKHRPKTNITRKTISQKPTSQNKPPQKQTSPTNERGAACRPTDLCSVDGNADLLLPHRVRLAAPAERGGGRRLLRLRLRCQRGQLGLRAGRGRTGGGRGDKSVNNGGPVSEQVSKWVYALATGLGRGLRKRGGRTSFSAGGS